MAETRRSRVSTGAVHLDLPTIMRTLGDPVRLQIVRLLVDGKRRSTGEIASAVGLPASTCSYHLKQLLTAGINECLAEGTSRFPTLRRQALDARFPGLLDAIIADDPESPPNDTKHPSC